MVQLRGIGVFWTAEDESFGAPFGNTWGVWSEAKVRQTCSFLQSQNLNFMKLALSVAFLNEVPDYHQRIKEVLRIAGEYGIYCEFCIFIWVKGVYSEQNPITDVQTYEYALASLSRDLAGFWNALLGLWNEPANDSITNYNTYFSLVPRWLQMVRNNGFSGPIAVMGGITFSPDDDKPSRNGVWMIDYAFLQTDYTPVTFDLHAYYDYEHPKTPTQWPDGKANLKELWWDHGHIAEALARGLHIALFETGVRLSGNPTAAQLQALRDGIQLFNENNLDWSTWSFQSNTDEQFRMLDVGPPGGGYPVWNSCGRVLTEIVGVPEPDPVVKYTLSVGATAGIDIQPVVGTYSLEEGSVVNIRVFAVNGYRFERLEVNGVFRVSEFLDLVMDTNYVVNAVASLIPVEPDPVVVPPANDAIAVAALALFALLAAAAVSGDNK